MKTVLNSILTLMVVILMTGCGGSKAQPDKQPPADGTKKMSREDFKNMTPEQRKKMMEKYRNGKMEKPVLVEVETIEKGSLNDYLVLNGTVEPERLVKVYSRLAAFVEKKLKDEGDFVKKGETLCKLDETEIRISYQQAKIQLEQAQLVFKNEEKTYRRNSDLSKNNLISAEDLQSAEAAYEKARLDYENRKQDFKNLELQLGYTHVTSPVDGYITERLVEIGDRVSSNQHVYTVEDFDPLLIKVYVPSADAIGLETGMVVHVTSEIIPGEMFNGQVKIINPRIDINSGTVKVTLEVTDSTHKLKPGMFVETRIIRGAKEDVVIVPRKSLLFQRGKTYAFVNKEGVAEQREVETGLSEDDRVEILTGLNEGESLVVVGVETLKDKSRIRTRP